VSGSDRPSHCHRPHHPSSPISRYAGAVAIHPHFDHNTRNSRSGLASTPLSPHLLSGMEWSSLSWSGFCSPNVTSFSTLTAAPSPKRCHPFFDHGCSHSFPQAALVHQVPLVSLWSSVAIFTRDIRLPYCGDFVFSKRALGEGGREVVYEEGTFDKRQVVGKMLSLNQCPLMLSEWGLSQLYCLEKGVTE
jgi:hypothetical protein